MSRHTRRCASLPCASSGRSKSVLSPARYSSSWVVTSSNPVSTRGPNMLGSGRYHWCGKYRPTIASSFRTMVSSPSLVGRIVCISRRRWPRVEREISRPLWFVGVDGGAELVEVLAEGVGDHVVRAGVGEHLQHHPDRRVGDRADDLVVERDSPEPAGGRVRLDLVQHHLA